MAVSAPSPAELEQKVRQATLLAPHNLAAHAWRLHRDEQERRIVYAAVHQYVGAYLQATTEHRGCVFVIPPGYGKALDPETPILTTEGWRTHGELRSGDRIYGADGTPKRVLAAQTWRRRPRYRVRFADGEEIIADERHEWDVLCDREADRYDGVVDGRQSRTTKRVAERLETRSLLTRQRRPPAIPVTEPLQGESQLLPIEPYVLGAWLGDGSSASAGFCCFDPGIITELRRYENVWEAGRRGGYRIGSAERCSDPRARGTRRGNGSFAARLRGLGILGAKRIPEAYLRASAEQRLALLQGLMDTDGSVGTNGQCEFTSCYRGLAEDVAELILSLGWKLGRSERRVRGRRPETSTAYRLSFHATADRPCFRLGRKRERLAPAVSDRARRRFVVAVDRVADGPTNCIQVEGGVYLAGRTLVPTHNSTLMQHYVCWRQGQTGGRRRIGLISNTASQAEAFARSIQGTLESDEFREVYPDCARDPARRWTTREMYFRNTPTGANPGLLALGMDGPILGKRLDEIIIDDPTTWRQARSEAVMKEQREKLLNTINYRFPPGSRAPFSEEGDTRMLVFMTRYGERDLLPTFRDDLGLLVVHMPALGFWDRLVTCPECGRRAVGAAPCDCAPDEWIKEWGQSALWPEMEDRAMLRARREHDELIFELVDQGNPKVLAGDMFDSDWWRHGEPPGSFDVVVMGVDTAGGRDRQRGDYTAIVVLGLRGSQVWLLYAWRDRIPATRQEDRIREAYAAWKPEMVYVEDANEGRAVYDHLAAETRIPIKAVTPIGDKAFRAVPLANAARRGDLWLPEEERWTRALEAEAEAFPEGAHDDFIDAATIAYNETEGGGSRGPRLRVLG